MKTARMLKAGGWQLIFLCLMLAVSLTGSPGVTGGVPAQAIAAGGFSLLVASLAFWQHGWKRFSPLTLIGLLLTAFSAASVSSSRCEYLTMLSLSGQAGFLACLLLLENQIQSKREWRRIGRLMLLILSVSVLYGLKIWWSQSGDQPLSANFTNPDCYSVLTILGFFLASGLAIERAGPSRLVCIGSLPIFLSATLLTASRAGLLGLSAGYVAFLFTLSASRSKSLRALAVKLFILPTVVVLVMASGVANLPILQKITRLSQGAESVSVQSRWDVLRYGWRSVFRHPLTGSGLGCFHLAYQQDRPASSATEAYMNVAHNDYMQWFVETGLPGGFLFALLLLAALRVAWRSYAAPTSWVASQIGATVAIATYCSLNFACPVQADLVWIAASLGLSGALSRLKEPESRTPWSPRIFPFAFLLAVYASWSISWGLTSWRTLQAEKKSQIAVEALDWEVAFSSLQPSLQAQPGNYALQLRAAGLARKLFVFTGEPSWIEAENRSLQNAYESCRTDPQVLLSLIHSLEAQGEPLAAARYVQELEATAAYSPITSKTRAQNQILQGQYDDAAMTLSSLERTGLPANDPVLGRLIYFLESKSPGHGKDVLRRIASTDPVRATTVGLMAAEEATRAKNYAGAVEIINRLRYLNPADPKIMLELSAAQGQAGDSQAQLRTLNRLRKNTSLELEPADQERLWKTWAELQLRTGALELVVTELEEYLLTHQRQLWPRYLISDVYLKKGANAEARAALREGVAYDDDGELRVRLADLCAAQGLKELARSYYQEALSLSAHRPQIEEKLRALKITAEESDQ